MTEGLTQSLRKHLLRVPTISSHVILMTCGIGRHATLAVGKERFEDDLIASFLKVPIGEWGTWLTSQNVVESVPAASPLLLSFKAQRILRQRRGRR